MSLLPPFEIQEGAKNRSKLASEKIMQEPTPVDACVVYEETSTLQNRIHEILTPKFEDGINWQRIATVLKPDEYELFFCLHNAAVYPNGSSDRPVEMFGIDVDNPKDIDLWPRTFLKLLNPSLHRANSIESVLATLEFGFNQSHTRVRRFEGVDWYSPILSLLSYPSEFVQHTSARVFAKIALFSSQLVPKTKIIYYLVWIQEQLCKILSGHKNEYIQNTARCLQWILRIEDYRVAFFELGGIKITCDILNKGRINFQIQYQLCFALWLMSSTGSIVEQINKHEVISILSEILKHNEKEKVNRMILAFFHNIIEKPENRQVIKDNCMSLLRQDIFKRIELLEHKNYKDEDIVGDIEIIKRAMDVSVQDLSSFDEYSAEIKSGKLSWTPVHKCNKFWKDNASKLNENNYELLKMLIHLLKHCPDPLVLSVACFDLGEYCRHYSRGKIVLEQLEGKEVLMNCMNHKTAEVHTQALYAVQKLMIHNWEYLQGRQK